MQTPTQPKRVAIVIGAASGIGRAIAQRLTEDVFEVVAFDIDERVFATQRDFKLNHAGLVDVRSPGDLQRSFAEVHAFFGHIDVLVNSAGTCQRESFEHTSLERFSTDIETNLTGAFFACQAAVFPYMRSQRSGRLVNIASVSGKVGGVGPVHEDASGGRSGAGYAAAKAGLINVTRWIAREVGKWGITCNAVAPGPIDTGMTRGHQYDFGDQPIQRWGQPDEVADAVAYLVSSSAGFVTAACLHVDGGLVRS